MLNWFCNSVYVVVFFSFQAVKMLLSISVYISVFLFRMKPNQWLASVFIVFFVGFFSCVASSRTTITDHHTLLLAVFLHRVGTVPFENVIYFFPLIKHSCCMAGKSSVHNKNNQETWFQSIFMSSPRTLCTLKQMLPSNFPDFVNKYWSLYDGDD